MEFSGRRFYAALGVASALVAGGVATAVVLAFTGSSQAAPTKAQYFARVAAVCKVYGPKLDRIPAADIAEPGNIIEDVGQALPLIKAEMGAVRAIPTPKELQPKLDRWFALHDESIAYLEAALRAGKKVDLRALIVAYGKFILQGPKTRRLGGSIGIPTVC
jgi:hypothetical protein